MQTLYPIEVDVVLEPGTEMPEGHDLGTVGTEIVAHIQGRLAQLIPGGITESTPFAQHEKCVELLKEIFGFQPGDDPGLEVPLADSALKPDRPIWSVTPEGNYWRPAGGASWELIRASGAIEGLTYYLSLKAGGDPSLRSCRKKYTFEARTPVFGFVMLFAPSRTEVVDLEIPGYPFGTPEGPEIKQRLPHGGGLDTVWQVSFAEPPFDNKGTVDVVITYRGDPPILRQIIWLVVGEFVLDIDPILLKLSPHINPLPPLLSTPPSEATLDPTEQTLAPLGPPTPPAVYPVPEELMLSPLNGLANYAISYDEFFQRRQLDIENLPASLQGYARFFLELERLTHPLSSGVGLNLPQMMALGDYLSLQYFARAEVLNSGADSTLAALNDSAGSLAAAASPVGVLFKDLFLRHFKDSNEEFSLDELEKGFSAFAKGELAVDGNQGIPNGTNYFCFVELGLLILEDTAASDYKFWSRVTQVLAKTAEIYARSFHHCDGGRTVCDYDISDFENARSWSQAELQALDASWNGLTEKEWKARYAQVLEASLRGEFSSGSMPPKGLRSFPDVGCPINIVNVGLRAELVSLVTWPPKHPNPDQG